VKRVGNTCRVTDKVNIPNPQRKLQRRIDMVMQLSQLDAGSGAPKVGDDALTSQTWEPSDREIITVEPRVMGTLGRE
jgi:hypothetical protein